MRVPVAFVILLLATPVYAQSLGTSSGAMAMINSDTSTQARVTTTPTVVAPGLAAAGIETCLGSSAGGISLMGGGFTFGSTKVDEGCTIRLLARQLYAFGFQKAALALMCQDERVAAAMEAAGSSCPGVPGERSIYNQVSALPAQEEYIVRKNGIDRPRPQVRAGPLVRPGFGIGQFQSNT